MPPFRPDLAPSYYYLFASMANGFASEKFAPRKAYENRRSRLFNTNWGDGFFETDNVKLPPKR